MKIAVSGELPSRGRGKIPFQQHHHQLRHTVEEKEVSLEL